MNYPYNEFTILIVDDVVKNIQILGKILHEQGYNVEFATSGKEALELANNTPYDLVLLDIMMPEMNGFEVCRTLKSNEKTKGIPVIFMTALSETEHKVTAFEIGAVDYITKPFQGSEVLARISTHITLSRLQSELREANKILEQKVDERTKQYLDANQELVERNSQILKINEDLIVAKEKADQSSRNLITKNEEYEAVNEELRQTNEELFIAKVKAEESDRLKDAFLQNMSHEVRTPMNAIVGFSQMLVVSNDEPSKQEEYMGYINEGCDKLMEIITDVIEMSQIQANQIKIKYSDFDIVETLNGIAFDIKPKLRDKNIEFIYKLENDISEFIISSDKSKIERTVKHLIDNAIKFTLHGFVKFFWHISQTSIEIIIQDSGIGITKEMQEVIFKPFRQVEMGIRRNFGGNGLGLAIAKAYIELLNGQITLDSRINEGTTIRITLPVRNIANMVKAPVSKTIIDLSGISILIAEDERINFAFLKSLLEDLHATIHYAQNGQVAIDFCRNNSDINIVLMDIKMPVMDGGEATKIIKAFRAGLPVIALTAYAIDSDKAKFMQCGFDDYLIKPVSKNTLLAAISKFI